MTPMALKASDGAQQTKRSLISTMRRASTEQDSSRRVRPARSPRSFRQELRAFRLVRIRVSDIEADSPLGSVQVSVKHRSSNRPSGAVVRTPLAFDGLT